MGEQTGKAHLSNPIRLFYCHMVLLGPGKLSGFGEMELGGDPQLLLLRKSPILTLKQ